MFTLSSEFEQSEIVKTKHSMPMSFYFSLGETISSDPAETTPSDLAE